MDDDGGAAVAEQRVRTFAKSYVFVFKAGVRLSFHIDSEVQHVAGVVAFGILQAVFLVLGIEMWPRRLEVRRIALGILMEVNRMLAGRQIMKIQFEANTRSLLPKDDSADIFALGVFDFHLRFGRAGKSETNQSDGHC